MVNLKSIICLKFLFENLCPCIFWFLIDCCRGSWFDEFSRKKFSVTTTFFWHFDLVLLYTQRHQCELFSFQGKVRPRFWTLFVVTSFYWTTTPLVRLFWPQAGALVPVNVRKIEVTSQLRLFMFCLVWVDLLTTSW